MGARPSCRAGRAASPRCRADQPGACMKKAAGEGGWWGAEGVPGLFLEPDPRNLFWDPREPPAAIHQLLLTAGPGRMRLGVDVEVHGVAFLAPGAAGG